jgi:hypothetical protein
MSAELTAARTEAALFPNLDMTRIRKVIQVNLGGQKLGPRQLDRILMPTGRSQTWEIPTLRGIQRAETFEGVIVHAMSHRAYWRTSFDEMPGQPPDCVSSDLVTGHGDPGGSCATCSEAMWGSAMDGGRGQACGESRLLFVLPTGLEHVNLLPYFIQLPRTSLGTCLAYFRRLATANRLYSEVITEFSVTTEQINQFQVAVAQFKLVDDLSEGQIQQIEAYGAAFQEVLDTTVVSFLAPEGNGRDENFEERAVA